MEVKKLRIGNLVYLFGDAVQLTKDHMVYLLNKDGAPDPISLTEEWLIRFGFEPNGVYDSMRLPLNELTTEGNRTFIVVACSRIVEAWIEIIAKRGTTNQPTYIELQTDILNIKYVHQLQNLFFALTGEELEIKKVN